MKRAKAPIANSRKNEILRFDSLPGLPHPNESIFSLIV